MRRFAAFLFLLAVAGFAPAADGKGTTVELAGMKSTTPADWKEEAPSNSMRLTQFKLPKADGDAADAELAIFFFKGGGAGALDANLKRQTAKFEPAAGKDKVEEAIDKDFKVGTLKATYQDVKGTFLFKAAPFDPNSKVTKKEGFRQIYVIFETKDGQYYMTLIGGDKTVEKNKKAFDEFLKNFK
ncbi:hypothetical protein [Limnoglobus roseus]|uniref:PsbP C-terminal domain-containing protein n=1 Tax=Limnoglobus roseus TaxID=2598579 RepID=A0A5C1AGJ1_9BACT|nr:hypothetical protein [Limnoglobus roseus]QEL17363.1 hypothetical protein PX52LOC_04347 [Limnoglobus roseus]